MPPADSKSTPDRFQRRAGWKRDEKGTWQPDSDNDAANRARAIQSNDLACAERTSLEMLDEVLRITNRQLRGLTILSDSGMLNDLELTQLGRVHQIVLAQMRVKPSEDPMNQRDGETDEAYLERLESMKRSAK